MSTTTVESSNTTTKWIVEINMYFRWDDHYYAHSEHEAREKLAGLRARFANLPLRIIKREITTVNSVLDGAV